MALQKKYCLAILDEEASERDKFVNFFENDFSVVEIHFVKNVDELVHKIKSEKIDAIAIDYKLKDHKSRFAENGDFFFKELVSRLREFPAFIFTQDAEKAKKESKMIKPRFIIDKEILHSRENKAINAFKNDIKLEITTFKDDLSKKVKRLKALEALRKANKLDAINENEFLALNNEVSQSLSGYDPLPLKYFSADTNKKLDDIIDRTDKLIEKMTKKK